MAAFYPETAELRETLWPQKPVASTIWPIIEKNGWSLAFTQRFLALLFLLIMANGAAAGGQGQKRVGFGDFTLCLSLLESLWVGWTSFWRSQLLPGGPQNTKPFPPPRATICAPLSSRLHTLLSRGPGTMPSCGFPHSASTCGRSPFGNWHFSCLICFVVSVSCLDPNG